MTAQSQGLTALERKRSHVLVGEISTSGPPKGLSGLKMDGGVLYNVALFEPICAIPLNTRRIWGLRKKLSVGPAARGSGRDARNGENA